jgi:hypothetical protein
MSASNAAATNLVQLLSHADLCVAALAAPNLTSTSRTAIAARPLLAAESKLPPSSLSFVALGATDLAIPPSGSSSTTVKTFLSQLPVSLFSMTHVFGGLLAITEIGSQIGNLPYSPVPEAAPIIISFSLLREVHMAIVNNSQLTSAGVPNFAVAEPDPLPQLQPNNLPNPLHQLNAINVNPPDLVTQRIALITQLRTALPDVVWTPADVIAFVDGKGGTQAPPTSASQAIMAPLVTPQSTSQGIMSQLMRFNHSMGAIDTVLYSSLGPTIIPSVVATLVKRILRLMPTATNVSVASFSEKECVALLSVRDWDSLLLDRLSLVCNSDRRRASADTGDFLAMTTFFAVIQEVFQKESHTVPALRDLFDFLRGQVDAAYISNRQLVSCFLDIVGTFYGTAFALVSSNPTAGHGALLHDICRQAVAVPTELHRYLAQLRLSNSDKEAASILQRQSTQDAKLIALERQFTGLSKKSARPIPNNNPIPTLPTTKPFPCHRWLNKQQCAGSASCGFYHEWPSHLTAEEKSVFVTKAASRLRTNPAGPPAAPPGTPRAPRGRAGSPSGAVDVETPVEPTP